MIHSGILSNMNARGIPYQPKILRDVRKRLGIYYLESRWMGFAHQNDMILGYFLLDLFPSESEEGGDIN
jgi:hypothetical protein